MVSERKTNQLEARSGVTKARPSITLRARVALVVLCNGNIQIAKVVTGSHRKVLKQNVSQFVWVCVALEFLGCPC